MALSGVDKIEVRKQMSNMGFDRIVDAGLGGTSSDFDRYRVTVFDKTHTIEKHFKEQIDKAADESILDYAPYQKLQAEIGRCGTVEVAGASAAAPYLSAIAAASAVARLIAIVSGCECVSNEVRRLSRPTVKFGPLVKIDALGSHHAGRPLSD